MSPMVARAPVAGLSVSMSFLLRQRYASIDVRTRCRCGMGREAALHDPQAINFPTKRHWRGKSQIDDIDTGLTALIADVRRLGIKSIAVPPLGCGLGGLHWSEVRPRIERAFAALPDVHVLLFDAEDLAQFVAGDFVTLVDDQ